MDPVEIKSEENKTESTHTTLPLTSTSSAKNNTADHDTIDRGDDLKIDIDDLKDGKNDGENIWNQFLQDASKSSSKNQQGHLIVFGSPNSGKTSLISQFKKLEQNTIDMKKFLMLKYSYVNLTDQDSDVEHALLNIWQISEPEHCKVLDVILSEKAMGYVAYMICLDLSEPSQVQEQFDQWINVIVETQTRLLNRLSPDKQAELKKKIYRHIQFYINPNDVESNEQNRLSEEEKAQLEIQKDSPAINLGSPIIIVGTKVDIFRKQFPAEAEANDHFDIMLSYLRLWGLKYGASIFSMGKGLKDQARRILQYIDHRLFDTRFNRAPNVVVSLSNLQEESLFVPTGFDSLSILSSQAGGRSLETPFQQFFAQTKEKTKKYRGESKLKSQVDQTFLKTLEFELKNLPDQAKTATTARPTTIANTQTNPQSTTARNQAVQNFFNQLLHSGVSPNQAKPESTQATMQALQAIKDAAQKD